MNPILPGSARGFANVAFKPMCGSITPTQFGPMIRILPRRSRICFSSSAPAGPHSLNPAEMITAPLTPSSRTFARRFPELSPQGWRSQRDRRSLAHPELLKMLSAREASSDLDLWERRDHETIPSFPIMRVPRCPAFRSRQSAQPTSAQASLSESDDARMEYRACVGLW